MGAAAAYAYISMQQAIEDAGLTPEQVSNPRTGIIAGSGGGSPKSQLEANDLLREKGIPPRRPLSRYPNHGQYCLRLSGHAFCDQRH